MARSRPRGRLRVITSAATLVEVVHPRVNRPALEWTLSRLVVEPVTEAVARNAAVLLADAGLHGHTYAIDAMLGATALASPCPVTVPSPPAPGTSRPCAVRASRSSGSETALASPFRLRR